jgi:hypothetical protein
MAKPTSVRLDDDAEKYVDELTREREVSTSHLINEAVKFYYHNEKGLGTRKVYPFWSAQHIATLAVVQASLYDGFFPKIPGGGRSKNLAQISKGPLPVFCLYANKSDDDASDVAFFSAFGEAAMALMWAWNVHPDQAYFADEGPIMEPKEFLPEIFEEILTEADLLNEEERERIHQFLAVMNRKQETLTEILPFLNEDREESQI